MEQISAAKCKFIHSLGTAKERRAEHLFVAEGTKCVVDTLGHFRLKYLVATQHWYDAHTKDVKDVPCELCLCARGADMQRATTLQTPPEVLAVYHQPEYGVDIASLCGKLVVALDRVQDPGNIGTIVRLCDWMGVRNILASRDTVDVFNPKAVQATMGSIARVQVHYVDLVETLQALSSAGMPVYGTFLDGQDLYSTPLSISGIIVMGNEGSGISDTVAHIVNRRLFIPPYPANAETAESLNVAIATALTLSEFRRRMR